MTHWNQYGTPMGVSSGIARKPFKDFLKANASLWKMNEDDELWPVSSGNNIPEDYISELKVVVNWLKKNHINTECGYSFSYYDEEHENRSVGGISSTNKGDIMFCKIDGNGVATMKDC